MIGFITKNLRNTELQLLVVFTAMLIPVSIVYMENYKLRKYIKELQESNTRKDSIVSERDREIYELKQKVEKARQINETLEFQNQQYKIQYDSMQDTNKKTV